MPRSGASDRRGGACLLTGSGAIAAAAGCHVSAGGALPAVPVLAALVVVLTGLLALVPRRLRTARTQLMAAVALQPALHVTFQLLPAHVAAPGRSVATSLAVMVAMHAVAGLAAAWLLRHADRLVAVGGDVLAALARLACLLVPVGVGRPSEIHRPSVRPLCSRLFDVSLQRRGPPEWLALSRSA